MTTKRRLPLLPSSGSSSDEPSERPAWQWVGFGALCVFVLWIPLAAVAASVAARLSNRPERAPEEALARDAVLHVAFAGLALAGAAFGAGYLVGRWGGSRVGAREAGFAGLLAGVVAIALSWASLGFSPASWLVAAAATGFAALGGRAGRLRNAPGRR